MLLSRIVSPFLLWGAIAIPLNTTENWYDLEFSGKPRNQVTHAEAGLTISVKASASPLFYALRSALPLQSLKIQGSLSALPQLPPGKSDGLVDTDDYGLRLGLVTEGDRRMNWFQRLMAPAWLKRLSDLAPEWGVGQIIFLKIAQRETVGSIRRHPKDASIEERVVASQDKPGPFAVEYSLPELPKVFALWIQADGDDTNSTFELNLTGLTLFTP